MKTAPAQRSVVSCATTRSLGSISFVARWLTRILFDVVMWAGGDGDALWVVRVCVANGNLCLVLIFHFFNSLAPTFGAMLYRNTKPEIRTEIATEENTESSERAIEIWNQAANIKIYYIN